MVFFYPHFLLTRNWIKGSGQNDVTHARMIRNNFQFAALLKIVLHCRNHYVFHSMYKKLTPTNPPNFSTGNFTCTIHTCTIP